MLVNTTYPLLKNNVVIVIGYSQFYYPSCVETEYFQKYVNFVATGVFSVVLEEIVRIMKVLNVQKW